MICAVHALVGAAVGKASRHTGGAFVAGVITHAIGDLLPHKDFDPKTEAPLLAATMAAIAWRHGFKSPEFWGAVGGFAPDFENAAQVVKLIRPDQMVFPTHQGDHVHGRKTESALPQGILALACAAYVFWPRSK